ncbi:MAG: four helix bundle suffix domain-containing protein [Sodaliphilus sp.]
MSPKDIDFAKPKSSYRKLFVFQKAEAIYDLTYFFLQNRIPTSDRTYDQMLQAARSGKQNIVEGRADSASSAEIEIKLFGVAKGSLHELLNDYEDYMRTRKVIRWNKNHERYENLLKTCRTHNDTSFFTSLVPKMNEEEYCNLMLTLIIQTIAMLEKMIELIKRDFIQNGGIKEQMHQARISYRSLPSK